MPLRSLLGRVSMVIVAEAHESMARAEKVGRSTVVSSPPKVNVESDTWVAAYRIVNKLVEEASAASGMALA